MGIHLIGSRTRDLPPVAQCLNHCDISCPLFIAKTQRFLKRSNGNVRNLTTLLISQAVRRSTVRRWTNNELKRISNEKIATTLSSLQIFSWR
jgi:hypothetical protein